MKLILSTHNVTLTKAIEDHILEKLDKLEHLDSWTINARVTLEHDKTRAPEKQFSCTMRLAMRGPDLFAEDRESDLYAAIDIVTKKSSSRSASATASARPPSTRTPPNSRPPAAPAMNDDPARENNPARHRAAHRGRRGFR